MKAFPTHFVLLADYGDVPAIVTENYAFATLGALNKDSIAHILLNFCITEAIDCIIPLHDYEIEPLAKSAVLFGEYGIQVLTPPADSLAKYHNEDKTTFQNFTISINGESVFASGGEIFVKQDEEINGVFGYNQPSDNLKIYTI